MGMKDAFRVVQKKEKAKMNKQDINFSTQVDFKDLTPAMQVGSPKQEEFYTGAFLSPEESAAKDSFAQNTAARD